jgi:hypothetical protein
MALRPGLIKCIGISTIYYDLLNTPPACGGELHWNHDAFCGHSLGKPHGIIPLFQL